MTRVLLVLWESAGGIGTHVRDLDASLRTLGHEVTVLTDAATQDRFVFPHAVVDPRPGRAREVAGGVDVVHAHGFRAGLRAVRAARGGGGLGSGGPPVVLSLHNQVRGSRVSPRRIVGAAAARHLVRGATFVTGASSDLVADAVALGARDARLAPVPSPRVPGLLATDRAGWRVEHRGELLARYGLSPDRPLALALGRVAPQKRLDAFVAASSCDGAAAAQWALVGPGQQDMAGRVDGLGEVAMLGESAEVEAWLLAADILVVPSEWEARALVVQEAMAAGTPVVASAVGGLVDLVDGAGVLVPRRPGPSFAARISTGVLDLLADPARAEHLAGVARERATGWPGLRDTARMWARWYEESLDVP